MFCLLKIHFLKVVQLDCIYFAAQYCSRIAVMEQGRLVEEGEPGALFSAPRHPYTRRLVAASPTPTSTLADLVPEGVLQSDNEYSIPNWVRAFSI